MLLTIGGDDKFSSDSFCVGISSGPAVRRFNKIGMNGNGKGPLHEMPAGLKVFLNVLDRMSPVIINRT